LKDDVNIKKLVHDAFFEIYNDMIKSREISDDKINFIKALINFEFNFDDDVLIKILSYQYDSVPLESIIFFIKTNYNINYVDKNRNTMLHLLVDRLNTYIESEIGEEYIFEILNSDNIEPEDQQYKTFWLKNLSYTEKNKIYDYSFILKQRLIATLLLEGINQNIFNNENKTPMDLDKYGILKYIVNNLNKVEYSLGNNKLMPEIIQKITDERKVVYDREEISEHFNVFLHYLQNILVNIYGYDWLAMNDVFINSFVNKLVTDVVINKTDDDIDLLDLFILMGYKFPQNVWKDFLRMAGLIEIDPFDSNMKYLKAIQFLLKLGIDPNLKDCDNETLLHLVVNAVNELESEEFEEEVKEYLYMIEKESEIETDDSDVIEDDDDEIPYNLEMLKELVIDIIDAGGNPNIENTYGKTAASMDVNNYFNF